MKLNPMFGFILLLHILGATVWTGGHLILATVILPRALKHRDVEGIRNFENAYEKIGIPALVVQIASGLWLAHRMLPDVSLWFQWHNPIARLILLKLSLLGLTAALAIDARLRVIPRLGSDNLQSLAWHIIPVTILSVSFVVVGVSFRTGWFMR
jgi:putative copper export protein